MKFSVRHTHSHISDEVTPLAGQLYYIEVNLAVWAVCVDVSNVHVYTLLKYIIKQHARSFLMNNRLFVGQCAVHILYVLLSLVCRAHLVCIVIVSVPCTSCVYCYR